MVSIDDILAAAASQPSPQAPGSGHKIRYSPIEANAAGISWDKEPPKPVACKYCGKMLYFEGIGIQKKIVAWLQQPQRCNCEKAVAYWNRYNAKQEQEKREAELAEQRIKKQARIDRLIGNSGIKKRFLSRTFEDFVITDVNRCAHGAAKNYADNFAVYAAEGKGLYFEGTYGTGKTHLAVAIAQQLMREGIPCICKTSIDLLGDIKQTFDSNGSVTERQVLGVYKDVDLLVIDDLGKEMCSEWSMATLYAILNDRYEAMRPTIITTNYNDRDLIARLTPKNFDNTNMGAMMSRLKGSSKLVSMSWDDWRLK